MWSLPYRIPYAIILLLECERIATCYRKQNHRYPGILNTEFFRVKNGFAEVFQGAEFFFWEVIILVMLTNCLNFKGKIFDSQEMFQRFYKILKKSSNNFFKKAVFRHWCKNFIKFPSRCMQKLPEKEAMPYVPNPCRFSKKICRSTEVWETSAEIITDQKYNRKECQINFDLPCCKLLDSGFETSI